MMEVLSEKMESKGIKIVITGGSGFIGTCAVDYCIQNGYPFVNLDIKRPNKKEHEPFWREVDIRDRDAFEKALSSSRPTHILHLAAQTGMDIPNLEVLSANTTGVKYLIEIGRHLAGLRRIVFISSLLVCKNGYIPQNDIDYCPPNFYGESKMIGEIAVREAENLPYSWTIVRPTSVWGPWFEHSYKTFFKTIDRGLYFHSGRADIVKPLCYVGNAVYMMFKIMFDSEGRANGQTFYLADYPTYYVREWADTIHRELKKSGSIRTIPFAALKLVAFIGDALKLCGWQNFPLTSFRLKNMGTGGIYPVEKTGDLVGPLPYSLRDGVHATVNWMRFSGELK